MKCPMCEGATSVVDSRPFDDYIYRRRACDACEFRFQTRETMYVAEDKPKKEKRKPGTRPVREAVVKKVKEKQVSTRRRVEDLLSDLRRDEDAWDEDEWRNL